MSEAVEERGEREFEDTGSHNHSRVQANLAHLFKQLGKYAVYIELSLDSSSLGSTIFQVKDEIIPDLCLYPQRPWSLPRDTMRMTEMPLLVAEILSPRQGTDAIFQKFEAYFALGVQSCWFIEPTALIVQVYSQPDQKSRFASGIVIDKKLNIEIPVAEIFE
ncbi:MAG: Uma2 family endonuclease [Caldilineaceae bacterium]